MVTFLRGSGTWICAFCVSSQHAVDQELDQSESHRRHIRRHDILSDAGTPCYGVVLEQPNGAGFLANSGRFVALRRVRSGARPFSAAPRIGHTSSV